MENVISIAQRAIVENKLTRKLSTSVVCEESVLVDKPSTMVYVIVLQMLYTLKKKRSLLQTSLGYFDNLSN